MIRYAAYLVSRIDRNDKTLIATANNLVNAIQAFEDYNTHHINRNYKKVVERQRCEWVTEDKITYL
ncbi:hypothetical protein bas09_0056 [Changchunvirus paulsarasin]|uniref:Uncharacterized protein n=2 Tax=Changchunvirus TaxID=2842593 RepID=A0AAE7VXB4_9CAUD|nr:hypothetical protein KMB85_gp43 [Escherichia phage vB_EcoS_W011D]QCW18490.1 hypothetical protein vBEcoSW011D_43 [Escherichia phage vB_EcoS_W011D]QXV83701.1 hypothetical protein bas09_0056 [Escherichia phage PaulSarasin]